MLDSQSALLKKQNKQNDKKNPYWVSNDTVFLLHKPVGNPGFKHTGLQSQLKSRNIILTEIFQPALIATSFPKTTALMTVKIKKEKRKGSVRGGRPFLNKGSFS